MSAMERAPRTEKARGPRVFMMDLLAIVPYYTAYLSSALERAGAEVTVGSITYYLDTGCLRERGLRGRPGLLDVVGRYRLSRWPRRLLKTPEALLNLLALAARWSVRPPEILHVQFLPMLRWPIPLDRLLVRWARHRGSRVVLTVHDILPHDTGDRHQETFQQLYSEADALLCHSTATESRLAAEFGVPLEKISVVPHGPFFFDLVPGTERAELRSRFGLPKHAPLVLWQGILFPYKGVDLLLAAWERVEAAYDGEGGPWLVIAGTGAADLLAAIDTQVRALALKRVRVVPRFLATEDVVALYRAAAVVVYPYRAITTSGALATGLALGKAVIASDLPVFREVLADGETALLVEPTDADALGGAIGRVLTEEPLRRYLEDGVRAMNFGANIWEDVARKTCAIYEQILRT